MDYEAMSDFEINRAVALRAYSQAECIPEECDAAVNNDTECQVIIKTGINGFRVDYCNNPSDAWPIILENKIGLSPLAGGDFTLWYAHDEYTFDIDSKEAVYSENPLRAAMIVFLMMGEE